jgi:signal transduction histidine kinase
MRLHLRSIRARVAILVLVPLLALVGLYAFAAAITAGAAITLAKATTSRNLVADPIGFYATSLQGERILAVTYLAAPTAQARAALMAQEPKTDAVFAALRASASASGFQSATSPAVKAGMAATLSDGAGLSVLRQQILARTVSRADAQAAYTKVIAEGMSTIAATVLQQPNVPLVGQSLDVLQVARAEDSLLQSEALLVGDVTARNFPAADHAKFAELVGTYRGALAQAMSAMDPQYSAPYQRGVSAKSLADLQASEDTVINSRPGALPVINMTAYDLAARTVAAGLAVTSYQAGLTLANALHQAAGPINLRLILAGGLGLLAIIVSVAVSVLLGRRLVRQLAELREDALELAHRRLPRVMTRLSAGDDVDVEAEAPPLAASADEIGQVRQAFNSVQRSAIEAAVSQARMRAGISMIFRNVARRSQVLLHQQLTLLDALERRAAEPAELEGLFRIDHLTTRMRRQAEGFVVLAGDQPGRTWTEPVPMADVLRGAVAEVVDYARIRVVCTSRAALQGRVVADAIHLIAELAENATVFSPPHTPVRIVGSVVVRGFAVEIEDRGLGMTPENMASANAAFLNPPPLDFPQTQQLGLYVAARLAQRHEIRVTLRSSPFGGTTAIVLIPMGLVVTEAKDAKGMMTTRLEGQPGEAGSAPTGRHASRVTAAGDEVPADLGAGVNGYALHDGEQPSAEARADTGGWEVPDWMYVNGSGTGRDTPAAQPEPPVNPGVHAPPPAKPPAPQGRPVQLGRPEGGGGEVTDEFDLPRRVRQANLAPQLRESPATETADNTGKRKAERSPDEIRDSLSAMQRGWERGRSDSAPLPEPGTSQVNDAGDSSQPPQDPPMIGGIH